MLRVRDEFFKDVSSLSDLCLAVNVDALLDEVTSLGGISLLPESDSLSDKIIIALCAIWTRSSYRIASKQARSSSLIAQL